MYLSLYSALGHKFPPYCGDGLSQRRISFTCAFGWYSQWSTETIRHLPQPPWTKDKYQLMMKNVKWRANITNVRYHKYQLYQRTWFSARSLTAFCSIGFQTAIIRWTFKIVKTIKIRFTATLSNSTRMVGSTAGWVVVRITCDKTIRIVGEIACITNISFSYSKIVFA